MGWERRHAVYGKTSGHSYRRFHTHVGKMVALSSISMNNLESFAVENFSRSLLVPSFRPFSCVTLSRENYRWTEKRAQKKVLVEISATNRDRERNMLKAVFNKNRIKFKFKFFFFLILLYINDSQINVSYNYTHKWTFKLYIHINEHYMKYTWIKLYINERFLKYTWVKASLKRNNIKKNSESTCFRFEIHEI